MIEEVSKIGYDIYHKLSQKNVQSKNDNTFQDKSVTKNQKTDKVTDTDHPHIIRYKPLGKGEIIIEIIDEVTGEVIMQIPSEQFQSNKDVKRNNFSNLV